MDRVGHSHRLDHWKVKTGKLISLSEQNLVDCSRNYGIHGCGGGWMPQAFFYIRDNHGIDTEAGYPYEARDANCRFNRNQIGATDTGAMQVRSGDENALLQAVSSISPISVAIQVTGSFSSYHGGVYYEQNCQKDISHLNHAVLIVGYETQGGIDYWLVKNSWGAGWGEQGYIKMARNKGNNCGIATAAFFPSV